MLAPFQSPSPSGSAGDQSGAPRHIAIIMDGNHRWAQARGMPGAAGHRAGAGNVRPIAEACADAGVEILTLFAFSTENWQRPRREVRLLMSLLRGFLERDIDELDARGVRLRFIGELGRFEPDVRTLMTAAEARTAANTSLRLNIAVNYGGRWDIVQAARALARDAAAGRLAPDDIDEAVFAGHLSLEGTPPPDLCIRTGGDPRISNFLLWDLAYSEFYFSDHFWPDFGPAELQAATNWFCSRQRRFGARP
ncbi:MAG: polyprenyl diphosphate synthase [Gammaproteobacteria bacterium]